MNCNIRSAKGNLAEFAPALLIFFLIILFPLIDMLSLAIGYGTALLFSNECSGIAGQAQTIEDATNNVIQKGKVLVATGLGHLVNLQIQTQSVYAIRTHILDGSVQHIGPLQRAQPPLDTSDYVYEYAVKTVFVQQPFVNMSGIPFVGSCPGLGTGAVYMISHFSAVEFPDGLFSTSIAVSQGGWAGQRAPTYSAFPTAAWSPGFPP